MKRPAHKLCLRHINRGSGFLCQLRRIFRESERCVSLTYADGQLSRPLVVLETDANWWAYQSKAGQTLIHDRIPVTKVLSDHLAVHNALWDSTVTGWKTKDKHAGDSDHRQHRLWGREEDWCSGRPLHNPDRHTASSLVLEIWKGSYIWK